MRTTTTNFLAFALALCCSASQAAPEAAQKSAAFQASSVKRQMVDCMNKRMDANRTLSYIDASRICKDQVSQLVAQVNPVAASSTPQNAVSAP